MAESQKYAIEARGVCKSFGGVHALKGINFAVRKQSIHCIVGENGAGKSTLMKIFSGVLRKDDGDIIMDGKRVAINSPKDSVDHGIGIIYQEFVLAPDMTVAENIFLDKLSAGGFFINWKKLNAKASEYVHRFGFNIGPKTLIRDLSVAYMQIIEITKALAKNAKILLLDEPTAVLSEPEIRILMNILRKLREEGTTIIYISHRLDEVFEIADDITIFKDGESIATDTIDKFTKSSVINLMTGRDMAELFPVRKAHVGDVILEAKNIRQDNIVEDISMDVRSGEVVGLAGLVGSGRTEFARTVFGLDKLRAGELFIEGRKASIRSPRDALRHGIGMVPENRKDQGLILDMSIAENMTMANLASVVRGGIFIHRKRENSVSDHFSQRLRIKMNKKQDKVSSLSGGNQQKVVLGKWLHSQCRVLILDEPTRGVDIGAKYDIYLIINELAAQGYAVIIISSELIEIIGMCDRAYVFNEGRVAGCLLGEQLTEPNIMRLAIPIRKSVGA